MLRFFYVEDRTLKRHISIGVFVVYIDTGSSMPISPSKSRDLADKILTEWKWFETTVLDYNANYYYNISHINTINMIIYMGLVA